MTPREFFPKMPDEVFDTWLAPFVRDIGWPFSSLDDELRGDWSLWFNFLPLRTWSQFDWMPVDIEFTAIPFNAFTREAIKSLILHCVRDLPTGMTYSPESQERFRTCADFVRVHNTIPKPVVVLIKDEQVELIDGYHRIAALLHVGLPDGYKLPMWVATPE